MTNREKAICEVYTGICFCAGERRKHVYEYAEELMGRPVLTHEFATLAEELKERAKEDFIAICKTEPVLDPSDRMTQFDPRVLDRAFVVQRYDPNEEDPGVLHPSVFWQSTEDSVMIYGDIVDRLALYEEDRFSSTTTDVKAEPMTREKILEAAKRCVCGDREQDYGTPEQNFQTIANLWIDYLLAKGCPVDIDPEDVAAMLSLLKIARISSGHGKADNWIDLAGYAACGGELEGRHGDA